MQNNQELKELAATLEKFIYRVYNEVDTVTVDDIIQEPLFSIAHTEMFEGSEFNVYLNVEKSRIEKRPCIDEILEEIYPNHTEEPYMEYINFTSTKEMIDYLNVATFESLTDLERDFESEYNKAKGI